MNKTITDKIQNLKNKLAAMTDIDETTREVIAQEIDAKVAQYTTDFPDSTPFPYENGLLSMGMGWDECMVNCLNKCGLLTMSYREVQSLPNDVQENLFYNSPGAKLWEQFFTE